MDDIQPPPIGTQGTVIGVDDIGSIMVRWDNGSSLGDSMERVDIYEYDRKNRERVFSAIEESNGLIHSWSYFSKTQTDFTFPVEITALYIDLSSLFYNEDRSDSLIALVEIMLNAVARCNLYLFW